MRCETNIVTTVSQFWSVIAFALALFCAGPVSAQMSNGMTSSAELATTGGLVSPAPNANSDLFGPGGLMGSPSLVTTPNLSPSGEPHSLTPLPPPSGQAALRLSARFGKDGPPIMGGLTWRVFAAKSDAKGNFTLIKEENSAAPTLILRPNSYIIHVGFGLATAVKPVTLRAEAVHEEFDMPAGGLRIEGRVGDVLIPSSQISFEIYKGSQFEVGDRRPIAAHVTTGKAVIVPEGTYYIVSNYGDANSVVRSDIRVHTGRLTDVTVTHHAAAITLKLVAEKGGEALANTAWSVLTPGGDVIKESIGAFPRVILAEGEYRAIARNDGKIYQREFKVATGVDGDVELLAK